MEREIDIEVDPESPALQYRIQTGVNNPDRWLLVRVNPGYPRTPDEHYTLAQIRQIVPRTADGKFVIPESARHKLDVGPGDEVSIVAVAHAQAQIMIGDVGEALAPLTGAIDELMGELVTVFDEMIPDEDDLPFEEPDPDLPDEIEDGRETEDSTEE